jgi:hypothetical protein
MTDSDNHSGNQRKPWSTEEWRLLIITFVGGLASIIVGAGALGLAVVLARKEHPGNDVQTWIGFVAAPLTTVCGIVILVLLGALKSWWWRALIAFGTLTVIIITLTWIGVAAGIK